MGSSVGESEWLDSTIDHSYCLRSDTIVVNNSKNNGLNLGMMYLNEVIASYFTCSIGELAESL